MFVTCQRLLVVICGTFCPVPFAVYAVCVSNVFCFQLRSIFAVPLDITLVQSTFTSSTGKL
jgi:hypothetical protein